MRIGLDRASTRTIGSACLAVLALAIAALMLSCSGGSDSTPASPTLVAGFNASATAPAANLVRLEKSGSSGDTVTLAVVLDGATTSNDVYAFAFDLVISDSTVVRCDGVAQAGGGYQCTIAAGNMMDPAPGTTQGHQALASQQGTAQAGEAANTRHVVVGVTKTGAGPGNGVAAGQKKTIATLTFKVLKSGSSQITFAGSSNPPPGVPPGAGAAIDSSLTFIPSIVFDSAAATITAS